MRALHIVLLAAILVALSFIAVDLHRVARELSPAYAIGAALISPANAPAKTREQRIQDEVKFLKEQDASFDESLEAQRRVMLQRRARAQK